MKPDELNAKIEKCEIFKRLHPRGKMGINPDFVWFLWLKCGTLQAAAEFLKGQGIESIQGRSYTKQALSLAVKQSKYYQDAKKEIKRKSLPALRVV